MLSHYLHRTISFSNFITTLWDIWDTPYQNTHKVIMLLIRYIMRILSNSHHNFWEYIRWVWNLIVHKIFIVFINIILHDDRTIIQNFSRTGSDFPGNQVCHLIISQLSIIMRIFVDENSQMKDLVGAPHRLVVRNIPYFVKTFFLYIICLLTWYFVIFLFISLLKEV